MKKIISTITMFALLVSIVPTAAFSVNINDSQISAEEYLSACGFEYPNNPEKCEVFVGEVVLRKTALAEVNTSMGETSDSDESIPAVIVRTVDDKGMITEYATFSLVENEHDELIPALLETSSGGLMYNDDSSYSPQDSIGDEYTKNGVTVTFSASYAKVNLVSYDIGGYGYAPASSSFKITKTGSQSVTNATFSTHLNSIRLVNNTDPTIMYENSDGRWEFNRNYTSASPIMNYNYNFNDYTYYTSQGYTGRLFHIVLAYGAYIVQTTFTYGSQDYIMFYYIHDGGGTLEEA